VAEWLRRGLQILVRGFDSLRGLQFPALVNIIGAGRMETSVELAPVDFEQLRRNMVDSQIRTNDVTDLRLLDAILSVPRELFVPQARQELAYTDEDVEISAGGAKRYLMKPVPLARLIQLADVGPDDIVLDAGSGTGYAAAIMSRIAKQVIALDSESVILDAAKIALAATNCGNVVTVSGPIEAGFAPKAPYDVIFVNGAVDEVPATLFAQLKEDGRLVAIQGYGNAGVAKLYTKHDGHVASRKVFNASVKPLPGFRKDPGFIF
jgi:protein-L-isoaspartate(D-aspartate) O-methyltransferase